MNPYLEQDTVWHDFHERCCTTIAELITGQVRPHYIVKIDEHVYIHELSAESRLFLGRADVGVRRSTGEPPGGVAVAAPHGPSRVRLPDVDIERISFLEIRDRESGRVVTVLELLSPTNKQAGPDRDQYIGKRAHLLHSAVHFVEIDLLRGGPRMPMKDLPTCDYYVMVSRYEQRPDADLWPIALRDRLPVIPVPLDRPHPHASLDLQQILDRVYDSAGYEDYIYRGRPQPALRPDDEQWSQQLLVATR
jgi:hypothetical protein